MAIFGPNMAFWAKKGGPKMAKNSKNIFLFFSRPSASFSCIITIYIDQISKNRFLGRFGTVRPESWKSGFFGRNPALPIFFKYYVETCYQELGRSHTPFSGNYGFTFILGRFGPFWDRLAQIPDFGIFREKSGSVIFLQISSPNYLPGFRNILQAVFQNFESSLLPYFLTLNYYFLGCRLNWRWEWE